MRAVDVEALAGSWDLAAVREGFEIVRRTALPGGFGNDVIEENRDKVGEFPIDTGEEPTWTAEKNVAFVFGTPPCSGWSVMNTSKGVGARGAESAIQQCTWGLIHYAARCYGTDGQLGPEIVSFECVQQAFTQGRQLMTAYVNTLRKLTGQDYDLTHVLMSGASVGAAQYRARYFFVAHRVPFGVDVVSPRKAATYRDAIYDLRGLKLQREAQKILAPPSAWLTVQGMRNGYVDWHDVITDERSETNLGLTIRILREANGTWEPGEYQKDVIVRMYADGTLPERAHKWIDESTGQSKGWGGPRRVSWDKPGYVIHGGGPGQFIHPEEDRWLTIRELTRLMGYPDDWHYPPEAGASQIGAWIGKNAPVQSVQWLSHYAMASLQGDPGPLRGVPDERRYRESVINVTHAYAGPEKIEAATEEEIMSRGATHDKPSGAFDATVVPMESYPPLPPPPPGRPPVFSEVPPESTRGETSLAGILRYSDLPAAKKPYKPGPRRQQILDLTLAGKKPREVAEELGCTTQNIYQHLSALRRHGLL